MRGLAFQPEVRSVQMAIVNYISLLYTTSLHIWARQGQPTCKAIFGRAGNQQLCGRPCPLANSLGPAQPGPLEQGHCYGPCCCPWPWAQESHLNHQDDYSGTASRRKTRMPESTEVDEQLA